MAWSQVDRREEIVRLDVGESKNADSRIKYLDDELKKHFKPSVVIEKKSREFLPSHFLNEHGTDRVKRFDKAWKKACGETGIGVKIFHDFRRTAVGRNMVRSGVLERVAMLVSGHQTRSVLTDIISVNDEDLKIAAERYSIYLWAQNGHNPENRQR